MSPSTLSHQEIAARLPHEGDMCLLHKVDSWDGQHIQCTAISHRDENNPLRRDGLLAAVNLIEYAAQAMAIHGSLVAVKTIDSKSMQGRLVSVRDFVVTLSDLAVLVEPLHIFCELLLGDTQSSTFSFTVKCNHILIGQGRASVMFVNN